VNAGDGKFFVKYRKRSPKFRMASSLLFHHLRIFNKLNSTPKTAGLGEYRIRDLNDEINKLLREKYHWEVQIFNLGGPNYRRIGPRYLDREGREVPGNRGYRYFGAARDLPGK
jgi:pre-mRNA-splicing factor ISY1